MMGYEGIGFSDVKALGRGMVNAVGLFILIGFLGFGLVEVPRSLWNNANIEGRMKHIKFKICLQSEALQAARRKLDETVELVRTTEVQMRSEAVNSRAQSHTRLEGYVRQMVRSLPDPPSPSASRDGRMDAEEGGAAGRDAGKESLVVPTHRRALVKLNLRLKNAIASERRTRNLYEIYIRQARPAHCAPCNLAQSLILR